MDSNIVLDAVRRSNRLMLLAGIICLLVVIAGVYLDQNQLISFFSGPREITTQELLSVTDANQVTHYWVTIKGSDAFDTGWQSYTESDSGDQTVTGAYAGLAVGKEYLLVKIPHAIDQNSLPKTYTGALQNIPDDVNNQVMADIRQQDAQAADHFLPVMIDTSDFRSGVYAPLFFIGLGLLIGLALLSMGLRRTLDPLRHPFMKALARYGDAQTLSESISQDMAMSHTELKGGVHVTRRWVIFARGGSFQAARLQDVVWVYQLVTQHRSYGIKTGKTYAALVWDEQGKKIAFQGRQQANVTAALEAIAQAAPWAVYGYSADLNQQWQKNRADFIAGVKQRRARD